MESFAVMSKFRPTLVWYVVPSLASLLLFALNLSRCGCDRRFLNKIEDFLILSFKYF